jgi:prepilin-type N-terminal cleavage/methylation domain-containing protein
MTLSKKQGFSLIEIIIVIIIVGVLASLALPRLFTMVEFSRSTEGLNTLSALRQSVERCGKIAGAGAVSNFATCQLANLDIGNPGTAINSHFAYTVGAGANTYTITATRNTLDGGTATDTIVLTVTTATITRSGTGAFVGIK